MAPGHSTQDEAAVTRPAASRRSRSLFAAFMLLLAIVFLALGTWQVQRLFWKLDLIATVDARVHAAPTPAPARPDWAAVTADRDEYRHVTATGIFEHDREALVQAVTERGPGFWVITPLVAPDGSATLINRGFVPPEKRDPASRSQGQVGGSVSVTGLLRISEPGGAFLRANDAKAGRWYSRDVAAIAAAEGLGDAAPYFIDADSSANPGGLPVGGLTIVEFRNSHFVYAITWYALAAMSAGAMWAVWRRRFA